jgi:hypothetical protein
MTAAAETADGVTANLLTKRRIIRRTRRSDRLNELMHPLDLTRLVFVVLLSALVMTAVTTAARPRTRREWMLVRAVIVLLAWALVGLGWLHS